ncbi:unnamed protein product, partial [Rotaria socialis]
ADSVTSNTNRTVLPKSNRQAAHSPPRHHIQIPIASSLVTLTEPNISSSLPLSPLAESLPVESSLAILTPSSKPNSESTLNTIEDTEESTQSEKIIQKIMKPRPFISKTVYRSRNGMTPGRTHSGDFSCNATHRSEHHTIGNNNVMKPKSLEDDESDLQHVTSQQTVLLNSFSTKFRRKLSTNYSLCSARSQTSLPSSQDVSRRNSESTLSHNYYNTVHGNSSDKHRSTYVPLTSIFSTKVITGAKSTPDLNKLLERKQAGCMYTSNFISHRTPVPVVQIL